MLIINKYFEKYYNMITGYKNYDLFLKINSSFLSKIKIIHTNLLYLDILLEEINYIISNNHLKHYEVMVVFIIDDRNIMYYNPQDYNKLHDNNIKFKFEFESKELYEMFLAFFNSDKIKEENGLLDNVLENSLIYKRKI